MRRFGTLTRAARAAAALLLAATPAAAQVVPGRAAVDALSFDPIEFEQPTPEHHELSGVRVFLMQDHALPLVNVFATFEGGYGLFGRESYAAAMGLPALMRYGGTERLSPDSVDAILELYAVQTSFGSAGGGIASTVNTLTEHLGVALSLWGDMITRPGFDADEVEIWRGRQLESVLRRRDDPAGLAFAAFNHLLYGDHPIGWEMEAADLTPERVSEARLRAIHRRIVCRENLLLGVTGDITWAEARARLEPFVQAIPPCAEPLPDPPEAEVRREPGIFLIEKDLEQAVIVMAHPTDLHLGDTPEYFSATIGNSILGAGGFSSRIMGRVRTEEGYAYSASSLWTTPRENEGLVGAVTRTRPENAVPAIEVILGTMSELSTTPPSVEEVETAVDRIVNGFVFNFDTPGQVVARTMAYLIQDLPEDWLERYVRGVQRVTPAGVRDVFADHVRPDRMTILILGDPDRIGRDRLATLGPVTVLGSR